MDVVQSSLRHMWQSQYDEEWSVSGCSSKEEEDDTMGSSIISSDFFTDEEGEDESLDGMVLYAPKGKALDAVEIVADSFRLLSTAPTSIATNRSIESAMSFGIDSACESRGILKNSVGARTENCFSRCQTPPRSISCSTCNEATPITNNKRKKRVTWASTPIRVCAPGFDGPPAMIPSPSRQQDIMS